MNINFRSEIILGIVLSALVLINGSTNMGQYFSDYINLQIVTFSLVSVAWVMVSAEIIAYLFLSKKEIYNFYNFKSKYISFKITNKGLSCRSEAADAFVLKIALIAISTQIGFVLNLYALSIVVAVWSAYNVFKLLKIRKQFAY